MTVTNASSSVTLLVGIAFHLGSLPVVDAQAQGSNMVPLGGASIAVICPNGNYMRFTSMAGQNVMSCSLTIQPDVGPFGMLNNFNVDSNGAGSAQALTDGGAYYMNVQGHGSTEFMTSTPYNRPNNQGNYTLQTSSYGGPSGTGFHNYESAYNFYVQPDGRYKIQAIANNGPYDSSAMPIYNGPDVGYWVVQDDDTIFTPNSVGPSEADLFSIVLAPDSIVSQSFAASDNLASNTHFTILNSVTGCYWKFSNGVYSPSGSSASASTFMVSNSTIHPGLNGLYDITLKQYVSIPSNSSAATGSSREITRETELLIIPAGTQQYVLWTQTNPGAYLISSNGALYPTGSQPEINTFVSLDTLSTSSSSSHTFPSSSTSSSQSSASTIDNSSSSISNTFQSVSASSTVMVPSSSSSLSTGLSSSAFPGVSTETTAVISTTSSRSQSTTITMESAISTDSSLTARSTAAQLNAAGLTTERSSETSSSIISSMSSLSTQSSVSTSRSSSNPGSSTSTSALVTPTTNTISSSTPLTSSSPMVVSSLFSTTTSISTEISAFPHDTTSTISSFLGITTSTTSSLTSTMSSSVLSTLVSTTLSSSLSAIGTLSTSTTSSDSLTTMSSSSASLLPIFSATTAQSSQGKGFGVQPIAFTSMTSEHSNLATTGTLKTSLTSVMALVSVSDSVSSRMSITTTITATSATSTAVQTCSYAISGYACGPQSAGGAFISAAGISNCANTCNADIACRGFTVDAEETCTYLTSPSQQIVTLPGTVSFNKISNLSTLSSTTSAAAQLSSASLSSAIGNGAAIAPVSQTNSFGSDFLFSTSTSMSLDAYTTVPAVLTHNASSMHPISLSFSLSAEATGGANVAAIPISTNVAAAASLASTAPVALYTNATTQRAGTQIVPTVTTISISEAGRGADISPQQTTQETVHSTLSTVVSQPAMGNAGANIGALPASEITAAAAGPTTLSTQTTIANPTQASSPSTDSLVNVIGTTDPVSGSPLDPIVNPGRGVSAADSAIPVLGSPILIVPDSTIVATSPAQTVTVGSSSGSVVGSAINVNAAAASLRVTSTIIAAQTMSATGRASSVATNMPSVSFLPSSTSASSTLKTSVSCLMAILSVLLII